MKTKTCKFCKAKVPSDQAIQIGLSYVCSLECKIEIQTKIALNSLKKQKSENRKALKQFSDKDIPTLKRLAQKLFNAYIRKRDQNLPCISCQYYGNNRQWHAGHFMSQGGNSSLRFCEDNVHKQCSICNNHLSGNLANYRKALIEKIGEDRVIELETNKNPKRWNAEELHEIIKTYRAKLKN